MMDENEKLAIESVTAQMREQAEAKAIEREESADRRAEEQAEYRRKGIDQYDIADDDQAHDIGQHTAIKNVAAKLDALDQAEAEDRYDFDPDAVDDTEAEGSDPPSQFDITDPDPMF